MPIPKPRPNEKEDTYHSRCMGDPVMVKDYPDQKQRNAICYSEWDRHHPGTRRQGSMGDETVGMDAALTHNSTIADTEPPWSSVDKSALPRQAFADQGDAGQKSSWGYPHHWVSGGTSKNAQGIWTDGTLYLHTSGWQAAWNAAHGARSGQQASSGVISHLEGHRAAIDRHREQKALTPLRDEIFDTAACFRAHLGLWAIEPYWMQEAVQAIKLGLWPMQALTALTPRPEGGLYTTTSDGVALIRIVGQLTKGLSKFGGTSAVLTRRAIRQAVAAEDVHAILLAIDSPGGQVDGIQDVADEVTRATQTKPVTAYIEDLGASAAYWIASQAQRITANKTAEIGSIGVIAALEDTSGKAARDGVVVHVVTTSPYKAIGRPGTQVLPEHLAYLGEMVQQMGSFFFDAVQRGRNLSDKRLAAVADGRVFIAGKAQELGLIDGVESFDEALTHAARMRPRRRYAAAHTELAQLRAAWETLP